MMRLCSAAGAMALAAIVGVLPGPASAAPVNVADYQDDFRTGTPGAGWSYLWNANGPLGNRANYAPLVADNGRYESVANGVYPDPAPGNFVATGSSPVEVARYPDVPG